ncbi:MAG: DUF2231 domain-containing protein [Burkholderiaceae bacterium]
MRTPASIAGHPLHPMLITIPVGLFVFSLICDLISLRSATPETWITVAQYTMAGGFIGALIAAVPGIIDFLSLEESRVRKIAILHMALNLVAVTLYAVNLWMRIYQGNNQGLPLILSLIAAGILGISGWLGAEMVHKHGIGVDPVSSSSPRQ